MIFLMTFAERMRIDARESANQRRCHLHRYRQQLLQQYSTGMRRWRRQQLMD